MLVGLLSQYAGKSFAKCIGTTSCLVDGENISVDEWQGHEQNELHLGFSRDSFFFSRPEPPSRGSYRTPFIAQTEDGGSGSGFPWKFGNVQSVAGGFLVDASTLRFFFSANSANVYGNWTGLTGSATLRRDGYDRDSFSICRLATIDRSQNSITSLQVRLDGRRLRRRRFARDACATLRLGQ